MIFDGEEFLISSHHQQWMTAWHPPEQAPEGKQHGSAGICVTEHRQIILVSADGASWDVPAGRPIGDENWEQTLRREVLEEACAVVKHATLLGFSRGRCVGGSETGLILVRSIWLAEVELLEWKPAFETRFRQLVNPRDALRMVLPTYAPLWERAFQEL